MSIHPFHSNVSAKSFGELPRAKRGCHIVPTMWGPSKRECANQSNLAASRRLLTHRRWARDLLTGSQVARNGALMFALALGASLVAPAGAGAKDGATKDSSGNERRVSLFYTAEVHGAVEPCGCTSDPLGDVSRLSALMTDAKRKGIAVALVDAGGLLYPEGKLSDREGASADVRGAFLADQFEKLGLLGAALGETDLARGGDKVRPARLVSNLVGASPVIQAARVTTVGGIAIGVVGVIDPALADAWGAKLHLKTEDAALATKRDVERLRAAGAEIVVLLAPVDKPLARKLAKETSADIVVLGKRVGQGIAQVEMTGRSFLVAPQEEMQRIGRIEIVLRGPTPGQGPAKPRTLVNAGGVEANRLRAEEIRKKLERLDASLREWTGKTGSPGRAGSPGSPATDAPDGKFVAQKQSERMELLAEQKRLETPWQAPASGDYVVNQLVPLRRILRQDPVVVAAMKKLDQRIASLNLKSAAPPPAAEPGRASYVGVDKCASCHASAVTFWKKTVHGHAWKTLVDGGKQADYKCVSCHVTGFGQVGGSSLGFTKKLESVQCETCHGPGSLHVAGEGNEEPLAVHRDTPETVCLGCHTEQHSDTFQYEPYLRDIVGPGHGAKRRTALGVGPTGHELRSAAFKRAKLAATSGMMK